MTKWQLARHSVSIAGRVVESDLAVPASDGPSARVIGLARASVTIVESPAAFARKVSLRARMSASDRAKPQERIDQVMTGEDGLFWFTDLPVGDYTLAAEVPGRGSRFGQAHAAVSVSKDENGVIAVGRVRLVIASTSLRGKVTGNGQGAGVPMAEVRVKGTGEYSLTEADGTYMLRRIEAGQRTILVSAQGYERKPQVVTLAKAGDLEVQDINLSRRRVEAQALEADRQRGVDAEQARGKTV